MNNHEIYGLYAITDSCILVDDVTFICALSACLKGGASLVQYRNKEDDTQKKRMQAKLAQKLCHRYKVPLIINDDVDLALAIRADGVHLGQDDTSVEVARQVLGEKSIIGVSCYNSLSQAKSAEKLGVDYVAFGAVFSSPTKPHAKLVDPSLLSQAVKALSVPIVAIGGVTVDNTMNLKEQGISAVAVISDLFKATDIEKQARTFANIFKK